SEIGVAGPRPRHRRAARAARVRRRFGGGAHRVLPVRPVAVVDGHRDGAAERLSRANAGQDLGAVGLDLHPLAAAVAALAALELARDGLGVDRESGGQALEDHDEGAAVRFTGREKSQHPREILYEVSAPFVEHCARAAPIPGHFRAVSILQCRGDTAVPVIADRFLADDEGVVDLATGESARLSIDNARTCARARVDLCDRLFGLRHPLLLPLVDYGIFGDYWFEAHAKLPALRVPPAQGRAVALHLVRFLRCARVDLDAAGAARHVRPAVDGTPGPWRPIGLALQPRGELESIRTVLEADARPGVTAIVVHCAHGSGLRTAGLHLARVARHAGFMVIDSRFGAIADTASRHLCVFDWLP